MTTVAIACTTGVYALLFSRLNGREGTRGKIAVARIECSNTQRQKPCEEEGDDSNRPLAAFHGSTPSRSKKNDELGHASTIHLKRAEGTRRLFRNKQRWLLSCSVICSVEKCSLSARRDERWGRRKIRAVGSSHHSKTLAHSLHKRRNRNPRRSCTNHHSRSRDIPRSPNVHLPCSTSLMLLHR